MTEICFPPGTSEKTVVVPVLNDNLQELTTESFLVRLSLPTGQTRVQLNQGTATVRIEDDDGTQDKITSQREFSNICQLA